MSTGPQHMPAEVLTAAIPVLIYSAICLCFGFLLVTVLYRTRDGFSYVLIFAVATTCTTIVSIIQQCNYIANWHLLRVQQYEQSVVAKDSPALALGPLSRGFNAHLFWTILYFYNVDSMTMLFWAIALVCNIWNWRPSWIQRYQSSISIVSKCLAIVLPAVFSGLRKGFQVNAGFIGTLILMNILMLASFGIGAVCVILILVKYIRTRLGAGSQATGSKSYPAGSGTAGTAGGRPSGMRTRVDPWLVVRFTIAFLILSGFEVFLIEFEINRYHKTKHNAIMEAPDFSVRASVVDVLNYIPGVTASLLAFMLFGTTAQHRAMYSPMIAALNPFRMRKRPTSSRHSGSAEQWRRMESHVDRASKYTAHDIEMQSPTSKTHVRTEVIAFDEQQLVPKRANMDKILASREPMKGIGIIEDCESGISYRTTR